MTQCVDHSTPDSVVDDPIVPELIEERMSDFEQSFREHLLNTNLQSGGSDFTTAIGKIRRELQALKLDGAYEDFFELVRNYYESVDDLDDVEVSRATKADGTMMLYLTYNHMLPEEPFNTPLTTIVFSDINARLGDMDFPVLETDEDLKNFATEQELNDFMTNVRQISTKFNNQFLGNHGQLMADLYVGLIERLFENEQIGNVRVVEIQTAGDLRKDCILFAVTYQKFCTVAQRTVWCKAVISVKYWCLVTKPVVN